jgi:hypothetical protein
MVPREPEDNTNSLGSSAGNPVVVWCGRTATWGMFTGRGSRVQNEKKGRQARKHCMGDKNTLVVCLNGIGRASSFQCIARWVAATTHLVPGFSPFIS